MDFDLLHGWDAASFSFKITVVVAVAAAYVLFELVLLAVEADRKRRSRSQSNGLELCPAQQPPVATLHLEAFRPVSSWTAPPKA